MADTGKVCVMGGGSWATAIAKMLQSHPGTEINWYMRKPAQIRQFKQLGHNPKYLTLVDFDLDRIHFYSNINLAVKNSDTLVFVTPSAFLKSHLNKLKTNDLHDKIIVTAIKGIVPDENMLVSQYFHRFYQVPFENIVALAGPCHAEEVAYERLSYLTFAGYDLELARRVAALFACRYVKPTITQDVSGIEFGSTLKNVYAIASGI